MGRECKPPQNKSGAQAVGLHPVECQQAHCRGVGGVGGGLGVMRTQEVAQMTSRVSATGQPLSWVLTESPVEILFIDLVTYSFIHPTNKWRAPSGALQTQ